MSAKQPKPFIPPTRMFKVGEFHVGDRSLQVWRANKVIYLGATCFTPHEAVQAAQLLLQAVLQPVPEVNNGC